MIIDLDKVVYKLNEDDYTFFEACVNESLTEDDELLKMIPVWECGEWKI